MPQAGQRSNGLIQRTKSAPSPQSVLVQKKN
jgi:hypothetical protein